MEPELLPNWIDDKQGSAVLRLAKIACNQNDARALCATEVLLSCTFPAVCKISVPHLSIFDNETYKDAMQVIDLNVKGFAAHQVLHNGKQLFDELAKNIPPSERR